MAGFDNDVVYGTNVDFTGTFPVSGQVNQDGELLVGATTAPFIRSYVPTGSNGLVVNTGPGTIDFDLSNIPNSALQHSSITINTSGTLTGGGTVGLGGTLNISDDLSGFVPYTGATASVDLGAHDLTAKDVTVSDGNLNLPASGTWVVGTTGFINLNSSRWIHSTGGFGNFFAGLGAGSLATGNNSNVGVGDQTLQSLGNGGSYNTAIGAYSQISIGNAGYNVSVGAYSLGANGGGQYNVAIGTYTMANTGGSQNTGVGYDVMEHCGTQNIAIGFQAGGSYTGDENYNILVGHSGVAHESNAMHLGTQGTGAGQIDKTYIAGDVHLTSGQVVNTTSPGAYPYTTLYTDYVIWVDTSLARTINLIASPETGRTYRIKDITGSAAANNITITPAAGNIDGGATFVINTNYGSADVCYNGTSWSVL